MSEAEKKRFIRFVRDWERAPFDPSDIPDHIASGALPRKGTISENWEYLKQQFEITEYLRAKKISRQRARAGRKGGKTAGRGRPKKAT
jgi:hypothetical protein